MSRKAEKILTATTKLFLRSGVKKITMDDIAESSKVSKVTIYKYFVDKDTLYLEISRRIFSHYAEQLERALVTGDVLTKKLYTYLDVLCEFTDSGKFGLCNELIKYNHEIEVEFDLYLQTYQRTIFSLIDEGIESGLMKSGLDKDSIYYYIDMGILYYQQNSEYRSKLRTDGSFRQRFMLFYISNIFADAVKILSS